MKVIGITGGIGSGKSVVCKVFSRLGVPVYESDKAAHQLYENVVMINKIQEVFPGEDILDRNNKINRKKLSEIVFNSPEKLEALNKIVHPEVKEDFIQWME